MHVEVRDGELSVHGEPGVPPKYEDMRDCVDGYIEFVRLARVGEARVVDAIVNEEGLLIPLKPNVVIEGVYPGNAPIRGNVMVVATNESNGETESLTKEEVEQLQLVQKGLRHPVLQFGSPQARKDSMRELNENLRSMMAAMGVTKEQVIDSGYPEEMWVDRCRHCGEVLGRGHPMLHLGLCEKDECVAKEEEKGTLSGGGR